MTEASGRADVAIADMRRVVAAIDDRLRHSGGGCTLESSRRCGWRRWLRTWAITGRHRFSRNTGNRSKFSESSIGILPKFREFLMQRRLPTAGKQSENQFTSVLRTHSAIRRVRSKGDVPSPMGEHHGEQEKSLV
jgi:hypothetical protein